MNSPNGSLRIHAGYSVEIFEAYNAGIRSLPGRAMYVDPLIPALCILLAVMLALAVGLRRIHQPHVVAYILAGVVLGPSGLGMIGDLDAMGRLGGIGVILLLFFVGLEIDLPDLIKGWRIAVFGTIFQIAVSVGVIWLLGTFLDWSFGRVVLLGFVISLSSTAVVMGLLAESGLTKTSLGNNVIGILVVQDLALIPMLMVLGLLGDSGEGSNLLRSATQVIGGLVLLGVVVWVVRRGRAVRIASDATRQDEELQVLSALLLCFGLAAITGLIGLSSALGAMLAGLLISTSSENQWVAGTLRPFRVVFVGAFFVSIGMMIDLTFLSENWRIVSLLVIAVFATNTFINAIVLRMLGLGWRESLHAGTVLSQIGELSFVLAAVGLNTAIIAEYSYQMTVCTIALTLTLSPAWIMLSRRIVKLPPNPAIAKG